VEFVVYHYEVIFSTNNPMEGGAYRVKIHTT